MSSSYQGSDKSANESPALKYKVQRSVGTKTHHNLWDRLSQASEAYRSTKVQDSADCFVNSSIDLTDQDSLEKEAELKALSKKAKRLRKERLCLDLPSYDVDELTEPLFTRVGKNLYSELTKLIADSQAVKRAETHLPENSSCYIEIIDIKEDIIGKNLDVAVKVDLESVVEQDVSHKLEPCSPENITEDYDPLSLGKEQANMDHPTVIDKLPAGEAESEGLSEFKMIPKSDAERSDKLPVTESDSEPDDRQEFKEILSVKECLEIEDCQQVPETLFEVAEIGKCDKMNKDVKNTMIDYKCEFCKQVSFGEEAAIAHKVRCFAEWKPYCCFICRKRFWWSHDLREHRVVHWINDCPKCGLPHTRRTKKLRCPKCRHTWNRLRETKVSNEKQKVSDSEHDDHRNGKSKSKSKKKQGQDDIVEIQSSDEIDVRLLSEVEVKLKEPKGEKVDLDNFDQSDVQILSMSELKQKQVNIVMDKNPHPSIAKRLRKRSPKKSVSKQVAKVCDEKLAPKCGTCNEQFASMTDYRAHTQLVRCKRNSYSPVIKLAGI